MIFFSVSTAPDPASLILTAAEVAHRQALQRRHKRLAAARATRLLARLRRGLGPAH
jgi:hypothetical protein